MIRPLLPVVCVLAVICTLRAEDAVFEYDFSDLSPGPLHGQDGWNDWGPGEDAQAVSPVVATSTDEPKFFVEQPQAGDRLMSRGKKTVSVTELGEAEKFALEFDFCADGDRPIAMMGLGNNTVHPPTVGVLFGNLVLREQEFDGRIHKIYGPDGNLFKPNPGDWYRVRTEWNYVEGLATWTGTVALRNLTLEEKEFQPVFFDPEQKQKAAPLGVFAAPGGGKILWNLLVLRTGTPGGKVANFKAYRLDP